jgi:undecaprenyl-diphosphatase
LVDRADAYFASHGGAAVFLGRWVGALRAVVPFVAGLATSASGHPAWNAAASLAVAAAAVGIGATFRPARRLRRRPVGTWLSVVVVLGGMLWLTVRTKKRRSDPAG